jgi:hypothetical protein
MSATVFRVVVSLDVPRERSRIAGSLERLSEDYLDRLSVSREIAISKFSDLRAVCLSGGFEIHFGVLSCCKGRSVLSLKQPSLALPVIGRYFRSLLRHAEG